MSLFTPEVVGPVLAALAGAVGTEGVQRYRGARQNGFNGIMGRLEATLSELRTHLVNSEHRAEERHKYLYGVLREMRDDQLRGSK